MQTSPITIQTTPANISRPNRNAERQRAFKAKMAESGLVQANVWLPEHALADLQQAAEMIRAAHASGQELTINVVVNRRTGRLVGLKSKGAAK